MGLWYPKDAKFDLIGYTDADWAGDKVDRKSTSGACQFLGRSLVSWSSKKQNCVALDGVLDQGVLTTSSPDQLDWAEDPHGRILMGQFEQLPHTRKIPQDLVIKTRTPPPPAYSARTLVILGLWCII